MQPYHAIDVVTDSPAPASRIVSSKAVVSPHDKQNFNFQVPRDEESQPLTKESSAKEIKSRMRRPELHDEETKQVLSTPAKPLSGSTFSKVDQMYASSDS